MDAHPPSFRVTVEPGVVAVEGEIDVATVDAFAAAVREEAARGPVRIDLAGLTFMDSSGVRTLDELVRDGIAFTLAPRIQDPVRQILEITGMLSVLPFEEEHR